MHSILEARNVVKVFDLKKERFFDKQKQLRAVDTISLEIKKGQTVGIVGESGSGKSTISEVIGDLQKPSSGQILYKGQDLQTISKEDYHHFRKNVQFIFQSPKDSLHPFYNVKDNLLEPLKIHMEKFNYKQAMFEIKEMMSKVNLDLDLLKKFPSEISGGQAQRVAIARALLLKPEVIICDECVSALDVSVQAQILELLASLQKEFGTSYLFISHDISAVNFISDYVIVMKNGKVKEEGPAEQVLFEPKSDYTKMLISSSFLTEEDEAYAM